MSWKCFAGISSVVAVLVATGFYFLDTWLGEYIAQRVGYAFLTSEEVSTIPDFLFKVVLVVTILGWAGHFFISRKKDVRSYPDLFEFIGCSVPFAFLLKFALKYFTGRTNTREWLLNHHQYAFHLLQGGGAFAGFPSGHMAVFTALVLGICRYYPRLRSAGAVFLVFLALALIGTEYHFLSDVIAGAYVGLLVDIITWRGLIAAHRQIGS